VRNVDSDALGSIGKALGLSGQPSPGKTEFLDKSVDQVLDVGPLVRRGRAIVGTEGIFRGILQNDHLGAGALTSFINPYSVAANAIAPYPPLVEDGYDVWIVGASFRQTSGSGTVTGHLEIASQASGWGVLNGGAPVTAGQPMWLAAFDTLKDFGSSSFTLGVGDAGNVYWPINMRLGRAGNAGGTQIVFRTDASAIALYSCILVIALMPIGLGQDAAF